MATMLAMYILQQMWLCAADCNLRYINKILFTSIAFDCLILILKSIGQQKIPAIT